MVEASLMGATGRNVIANLFGGAWNALLSILFVPVYLRFLGAEAFGLVGVLAALQSVFGIFDFGLGATFNREMARLSAQRSGGAREREMLRTLEAIYFAIAVAIAGTVALFAKAIAHRWVHAQHLSPTAITRSIVLMGVIVACQFPLALYQAGLAGRQRQVLLNGINTTMVTLRTLGAVLLIWRVAASIELFFAWQALITALQLVATAALLWRDLPRGDAQPRVRLTLIGDLWKFSAALSSSAILGIVLSQTDKVLLSGMLPLLQFGYYTLAGSVATALWYVITPITTAFYPRFTEVLHSSGGEERAAQLYHRSCQLMAVTLLPLAAIMSAFAYHLILIWTRNTVLAEATALTASLLVCGTTLNGLANLPVYLGVAAGFPMVITTTNLIAVALIVPAIIGATRVFGMAGAAAVWVALNSLYILITVPLVHRRVLPREKWRWYANDFAKPTMVAAAVAAMARLLMPGDLNTVGTIAYVAASGIIAALATAAVLPHVVALVRNFVRGARETLA
jgi:O-antigen/teichoic acid export membrane protein